MLSKSSRHVRIRNSITVKCQGSEPRPLSRYLFIQRSTQAKLDKCRTPKVIREIQQTSQALSGPKSAPKGSSTAPNLDAQTPSGDPNNSAWGQKNAPQRPVLRIGPVSVTIILLVTTGIGWLGYRYYQISSLYPQPIRGYLKTAIAAMLKNEWAKAEVALRRALISAMELPPSELEPDPHLKLTGIAAKLGECLEAAGKPEDAFIVYLESLSMLFNQFSIYGGLKDETLESYRLFGEEQKESRLHPDWETAALSAKARLRAVGIANRAAMLAQIIQRSNPPVPRVKKTSSETPNAPSAPPWTQSWSELELYLRSFSVTQVLYLASNVTGVPTSELSTSTVLDSRLPPWLTRTDLAAPCEGLAECYVRRRETKFALPLYQTAYHFLLSPSSLAGALDISTNDPMTSSETLPNPTVMCMAASVLTAMSAAVMDMDNPGKPTRFRKREPGNQEPTSAGSWFGSSQPRTDSSAVSPNSHIPAVRSWAREARRLVDSARRITAGGDYRSLIPDIGILGRLEKPSAKEIKALELDESYSAKYDSDMHPSERDRMLVSLDLKRIQETNRRRKEAAFKEKTQGRGLGRSSWTSSASKDNNEVAAWGDEMEYKTNMACERTWAVALYNTGMVEAMDENSTLAGEYLQLALDHSRRINFFEGVERSKVALKDLLSRDQS
ncbi:hypothetical protein FRC15_009030 [Serendipita sp. 397]|nr:hypothetical protein FRC15_009030 [Serendipita sp. 397]KAG8798271.1 hypothetical protein FRC16_007584 [Serendipita sp. 398]